MKPDIKFKESRNKKSSLKPAIRLTIIFDNSIKEWEIKMVGVKTKVNNESQKEWSFVRVWD